MKKSLILCLICIFFVCFITGCVDFGKPKYSDKKKITTKYGDEFTILRQEFDFPDQEITIYISQKGNYIFDFAGFSNYLSSYDYNNDFKNNWYVIKNEIQYESVKAYQFNWGIIYSLDGGKTYLGVPKHEYYDKYMDETFKKIFHLLINE